VNFGILINGKIISGSSAETNEAIVIDGGKIIFVGSSKIASRFTIANRTVITDLKGKIVIPGFHDGHQNFLLGAALLGNRLNFYALDLESIIHR